MLKTPLGSLVNLLKKLASNANEIYVLLLITLGLPAIFFVYFDWRASMTIFVITQIALGFLRERLNG